MYIPSLIPILIHFHHVYHPKTVLVVVVVVVVALRVQTYVLAVTKTNVHPHLHVRAATTSRRSLLFPQPRQPLR